MASTFYQATAALTSAVPLRDLAWAPLVKVSDRRGHPPAHWPYAITQLAITGQPRCSG